MGWQKPDTAKKSMAAGGLIFSLLIIFLAINYSSGGTFRNFFGPKFSPSTVQLEEEVNHLEMVVRHVKASQSLSLMGMDAKEVIKHDLLIETPYEYVTGEHLRKHEESEARFKVALEKCVNDFLLENPNKERLAAEVNCLGR